MSIGKRIKQLRELRNYTQAHMAEKLGMTTAGYGKIERDETDVTFSKLNRIAEILETNLSTILSFDSNQVFNQYNNKTATANGIVQNQQIIGDQGLNDFFVELKNEINGIKATISAMQKTK